MGKMGYEPDSMSYENDAMDDAGAFSVASIVVLGCICGIGYCTNNIISPARIKHHAEIHKTISTDDVSTIHKKSSISFKNSAASVTVDEFIGTYEVFNDIDSLEKIPVPITRYTLKKPEHTLVLTDFFNDSIVESVVETINNKDILRLHNPRTSNIDKSLVNRLIDEDIDSKWYYLPQKHSNPELFIKNKKIKFVSAEDKNNRIQSFNNLLIDLHNQYTAELNRVDSLDKLAFKNRYNSQRNKQNEEIDVVVSSTVVKDLEKDLLRKNDSINKLKLIALNTEKLESILNSMSRSEIVYSDDAVTVSNQTNSKVFTKLPKGDYMKVASKNLNVQAINNIIFSPTEKVYKDFDLIERSYGPITKKTAHNNTLNVLEETMNKLGDEYVCIISHRGISANFNVNEKILSSVISELKSSSYQTPSNGYVASIFLLSYGEHTGTKIDSESASKEYANYKTIQYRITEKTLFEIYKKK